MHSTISSSFQAMGRVARWCPALQDEAGVGGMEDQPKVTASKCARLCAAGGFLRSSILRPPNRGASPCTVASAPDDELVELFFPAHVPAAPHAQEGRSGALEAHFCAHVDVAKHL